MNTWDKLKELHKKNDLSQKFPNYFYKPFMWLGMVFIFLFVASFIYVYGWGATWVYVECESPSGCPNPFLTCQNYDGLITPPECDFYNSNPCIGLNCDKERLSYNEYAGTKPPVGVKYGSFIIFGALAFIFGLNHIRYMIIEKSKKLRF